MYCQHATAEMTESHKASSTLSTNALDVPFFFRGRRMWPLARKSADPVGRVGSWRKRAPSSRGSVEELFSRAWGEVDWDADRLVGSPGCPPGDVQSVAARTIPGAFRGAGRARARPGCASGRPGEFSESQEAISGAIFDPRSTTFDPPWLFGELDKPRIQQS